MGLGPKLQDVLSVRRLQSLEYLHLNLKGLYCSNGEGTVDEAAIVDEAAYHLQMILNHPSIKKLSLAMSLKKGVDTKLAAALVKFEDVDLTECTQEIYYGAYGRCDDPILPLLLRSLIPASAEGDSKLKKLSLAAYDDNVYKISGIDEEANAKDLAEAREHFAVNIMPRQADNYSDYDDSPIDSQPPTPDDRDDPHWWAHNEFDLDPDYDPDSYW